MLTLRFKQNKNTRFYRLVCFWLISLVKRGYRKGRIYPHWTTLGAFRLNSLSGCWKWIKMAQWEQILLVFALLVVAITQSAPVEGKWSKTPVFEWNRSSHCYHRISSSAPFLFSQFCHNIILIYFLSGALQRGQSGLIAAPRHRFCIYIYVQWPPVKCVYDPPPLPTTPTTLQKYVGSAPTINKLISGYASIFSIALFHFIFSWFDIILKDYFGFLFHFDSSTYITAKKLWLHFKTFNELI